MSPFIHQAPLAPQNAKKVNQMAVISLMAAAKNQYSWRQLKDATSSVSVIKNQNLFWFLFLNNLLNTQTHKNIQYTSLYHIVLKINYHMAHLHSSTFTFFLSFELWIKLKDYRTIYIVRKFEFFTFCYLLIMSFYIFWCFYKRC